MTPGKISPPRSRMTITTCVVGGKRNDKSQQFLDETRASAVKSPPGTALTVACMTYGSVYQKRFPNAGDAWRPTALMFVGATVPAVIGFLMQEHGHIRSTSAMIAIYAWSVVALAVGAIMGLLFLIERGDSVRATSRPRPP
jgi:hypothetical protein